MDIKISQLKTFNNWDSFSFTENGKNKEYSNPSHAARFSKPVLAVNENNELIIRFQNVFERIFHPLVHVIFEKLKIRHTTTDIKKVWETLEQSEIVKQGETLPLKRNDDEIRQLFAHKINQFVRVQQEPKTPSPLMEKEKVGELRNSNQDFQRLVEYFEVYSDEDTQKAKALLDSLPNLNAYFEHSIDTPLTLAIKKENLDIVRYLLSKKDENGKALVDANKATDDIAKNSPLLLAIQKDLPRNFLIALFDAGAKPQNQAEKDKLIRAASDNQKYVQAIKDVSEGKPYQLKAREVIY